MATSKKRRREKLKRYFIFFLVINLVFEITSPTVAFALTGGTYQTEYLSFEPAGSSEMVDLFTGDYKYNIPLMDVDGYPINLAYHAGVGMDQEASWVGLGWSLNAGAINRVMKGLPDDFNGDVVNSETYLKPHYSVGIGGEVSWNNNNSISYAGATLGTGSSVSAGLMLLYNNYKGFGIEPHLDASLSFNTSCVINWNIGGGVGVSVSSLDGASISEYYTVGYSVGPYSRSVGVGTSINTRTGDESKFYSGSTSISIGPVSHSEGSSHTIPAGSIAYSPNMYNNYKGLGSSITAKLGFYLCFEFSIYGITIGTQQGMYLGFNSVLNYSSLDNKINNLPAFGYMNLENASLNSLLDFNREKEGPFFKQTPHAPMSAYTYDIFSATAQGLYHNFRTHRSDVGTVYDNQSLLNNTGKHKGVEIGVGIFAHFLLDLQTTSQIGGSGKWNTDLPKTQNYYNPDVTQSGDRYYEKNYFKCMGEQTAHDATFSNAINNESIVQPALTSAGVSADALNTFNGAASAGIGGSIKRANKRDIRKTNITYLNAAEAEKFGFEKQIRNYPKINHDIDVLTREMKDDGSPIPRTSLTGSNINHHISEISITKDDGTRYFYGIPVYNLTKKKVIFNASDYEKKSNTFIPALSTNVDIGPFTNGNPLTKNTTYEMVSYTGTNTAQTNRRGLDNFFHKEELPAYAQSYLLTAIVSPDYVDLTGDGPTYDDLGQYTKFNYTKTDSLYKWKAPYGIPSDGFANMALLDRGLLADNLDDKAFYEYGERQVWYLHSIETKNYVAEFILSTNTRDDMMGVIGEEGAINANAKNRFRLEKINLYTKAEKIRAKQTITTPVPIKTVNFEYDYSLCPGVFNNGNSGGKLTLNKVYFTYGLSNKSQLSPYKFFYADPNHTAVSQVPANNPSYDPKGLDRWGNFKERGTANKSAAGTAGVLNFDEFPYTDQDKNKTDVYASAWNLNTIVTPTGSKINIDYESDDYGYVQDKQAGQMLMLADFVDDYSTWTPSNPKNTNILSSKFLIIDLKGLNDQGIKSSISAANATSIVKNNLLNNTGQIYYKCFTKLNTKDLLPGDATRYYDYISGYADVDYDNPVNIGIINGPTYNYGSNTYYQYAYVGVKLDGHKDDGTGALVSPVTKAGWQMLRTYLPKIAYPGSETSNLGTNTSNPIILLVNILAGLNTALIDLASSVSGDPNYRFLMSGYCTEPEYDKSWVRVSAPYKKKLGGGHRVKQIVMNDDWDVMSGENASTYGQTYDYTTVEKGVTISSGVASYEPIVGGDEISLRKPIDYTIPHHFAPNDQYFMEEPLGEMFYPAPIVGYSKVTVKNIKHSYTGGDVCPIGQTGYEFYTAKDFPISVQSSGLTELDIEPKPIDAFTIMENIFKSLSVSEGYVLKLNDMHGKLKGKYAYAEGNPTSPISGTTYFYRKSGSHLQQSVPVIDQNKVVSTSIIGREIDAVTDLRQSATVNSGTNNEYFFDVGLCAQPLFGNSNSFGMETYAFQSAVTSKVVQQYGILDKVESFDNKSKVTTQNLLWDKNTGDVVLSQTTNNFDQPVYTFNYPAYWMYSGMGGAYQRQNVTVKITSADITATNPKWDINTGTIYGPFVNGILKDGDEVSLSNGGNVNMRCWVVYKNANIPSGDYQLVDNAGNIITSTFNTNITSSSAPYYIKVLRPVERNQFNFSAGSVTTLDNPMTTGAPVSTNKVLSATAIEYCSYWNLYCLGDATGQVQDCYTSTSPGSVLNQYTTGYAGNYRPWKTYAYKTSRDYSTTQPNTKADGTFSVWSPFWVHSSSWNPIYSPLVLSSYDRWVVNSENTAFTPHGNLSESIDAIGLYHSQLYGFNHTLLSAKANNAKASQIAYEGFEDFNNIYSYLNNCGQMSQNNLQLSSTNINYLTSSTTQPFVTTAAAHTGRNSLQINTGMNLMTSYTVTALGLGGTYNDLLPPRCSSGSKTCINKLVLEPGNYLTSFWVKEPSGTYQDLTSLFGLQINFGVSRITSIQKTNMINGWQKFDYYFTIPGTPTIGTVDFIFNGPTIGTNIYIDDWRIQPFNSTMTTYAYDPIHLRPWAELDDRNFATIMEYDNEGTLVRTKKETEKGIYTVAENRKSIIKQ